MGCDRATSAGVSNMTAALTTGRALKPSGPSSCALCMTRSRGCVSVTCREEKVLSGRALASLALGSVLLAGCTHSRGSSAAPSEDTKADQELSTGGHCGDRPSADPAAALPNGFPGFPDEVIYDQIVSTHQNRRTTRTVLAVVDQHLTATRDGLAHILTSAGYKVSHQRQSPTEAAAEFTGAHSGVFTVQPYSLCSTGYVTIRYVFQT